VEEVDAGQRGAGPDERIWVAQVVGVEEVDVQSGEGEG